MPRLAMAYHGVQFEVRLGGGAWGRFGGQTESHWALEQVLNKGLGDGRAFIWGQWAQAGVRSRCSRPLSRAAPQRKRITGCARRVIAERPAARDWHEGERQDAVLPRCDSAQFTWRYAGEGASVPPLALLTLFAVL